MNEEENANDSTRRAPWMHHVQCNTYQKVAVYTLNQGEFADIGFARFVLDHSVRG